MGIELTERARVCVESIYLSVETPIIPSTLKAVFSFESWLPQSVGSFCDADELVCSAPIRSEWHLGRAISFCSTFG